MLFNSPEFIYLYLPIVLVGFFWLAAQGGYGIQSAAGAALLARQLALDEPLLACLADEGITRDALSPARLR